jgi:hypothetical protein
MLPLVRWLLGIAPTPTTTQKAATAETICAGHPNFFANLATLPSAEAPKTLQFELDRAS